MDGYELPANPDHWDDGDKLTHTARLLQQAERERDEARRALNYARAVSEERAKALAEAKAQRDEALAKNTELGKMYLDAVSASQGHEMEAAMLEAERDAARAQVAALQDTLQHALDHLERIVYYDCAPFEVSSPFVWMDKTREEGYAWQDEAGNYDADTMVRALASGEDE